MSRQSVALRRHDSSLFYLNAGVDCSQLALNLYNCSQYVKLEIPIDSVLIIGDFYLLLNPLSLALYQRTGNNQLYSELNPC